MNILNVFTQLNTTNRDNNDEYYTDNHDTDYNGNNNALQSEYNLYRAYQCDNSLYNYYIKKLIKFHLYH